MDKLVKLEQVKHIQRIGKAKSKVDNKAPIVHSNNILAINKRREDAFNYMLLMKRNMQLLVNINATMRTLGIIDTFRNPILVPNNIGLRQRRIKSIENENFRMGLRLLAVRGTLNLKPPKETMKSAKRKDKLKKRTDFIFSKDILGKYNQTIKYLSNMELAKNYMRPTIYFDLEIQNVRPLGRIIIEMYTEAAPQIVLQFVRMCHNQDTQLFQFTRIFPSLWMEGKFKVNDTNIHAGLIEYDMRTLNNSLCGGIFSFKLNEQRGGYLFVAISFKPLTVVNGRRIAFARIKKGFRIIHCLQDFGTRNGKMTKKIVVVNCGIVY